MKDFITEWLDNVVAANVKMSSMQTYQTYTIQECESVKCSAYRRVILTSRLRKLIYVGKFAILLNAGIIL